MMSEQRALLIDCHDYHLVVQANHSFSTSQWRDRVARESANWIVSW